MSGDKLPNRVELVGNTENHHTVSEYTRNLTQSTSNVTCVQADTRLCSGRWCSRAARALLNRKDLLPVLLPAEGGCGDEEQRKLPQ